MSKAHPFFKLQSLISRTITTQVMFLSLKDPLLASKKLHVNKMLKINAHNNAKTRCRKNITFWFVVVFQYNASCSISHFLVVFFFLIIPFLLFFVLLDFFFFFFWGGGGGGGGRISFLFFFCFFL